MGMFNGAVSMATPAQSALTVGDSVVLPFGVNDRSGGSYYDVLGELPLSAVDGERRYQLRGADGCVRVVGISLIKKCLEFGATKIEL
ncbi:hypothetical protein [Bosea sp. PAMC 26642]|uniref:hypothetical protein n=1 Tax=Bosea sp. (strain PAMC 26642) TaxID=1792307 RepID=UPI0012E7F1B3|nr:hypothetical protein [Bosea sp. PAMC 26642]